MPQDITDRERKRRSLRATIQNARARAAKAEVELEQLAELDRQELNQERVSETVPPPQQQETDDGSDSKEKGDGGWFEQFFGSASPSE
jgi:hypothetical protein